MTRGVGQGDLPSIVRDATIHHIGLAECRVEVGKDDIRPGRDQVRGCRESQARLWHARFDAGSSAQGPTAAQQESYRIGRKLYDDTVVELTRLVDTEYAGLKAAMDAARVPWTPGRGLQE